MVVNLKRIIPEYYYSIRKLFPKLARLEWNPIIVEDDEEEKWKKKENNFQEFSLVNLQRL